jgi:hypothetical protein
MDKHPNWDYWQEEYSDGKLIVFDRPDSERDIRHEKYDLDVTKWCDKAFWDAGDAALISFFRDPDKIAGVSRELSPLHIGDDDYEEHNELMGHISNLNNLIIKAQERQQLSENFFQATMYVEWAKRMGISIPRRVSDQLGFVVRERRGEIGPLNIFEAAKFGRRPGYFSSEKEPEFVNNKNQGPAKRADNNSAKIILAILEVADLLKVDDSVLTRRIQTALEKFARQKNDKSFLEGVGKQTIESRLGAAKDLLL